ncbi:MAG: hypothetical protein M8357_06045 [Desulfobulbaceae bacterium]|nr:hypothetical protein [Desulfobulbaceae bacterium]
MSKIDQAAVSQVLCREFPVDQLVDHGAAMVRHGDSDNPGYTHALKRPR